MPKLGEYNAKVKTAVIMQHGASMNADMYFCYGYYARELAGVEQDEFYLVAPQLLDEARRQQLAIPFYLSRRPWGQVHGDEVSEKLLCIGQLERIGYSVSIRAIPSKP
jgi:hypothetical protein